MLKKTLGEEHTDVANIYYSIGLASELNGDIENALDNYIISGEITKDLLGNENELTQEAITNAKRLAKELNKESDLPEWMI